MEDGKRRCMAGFQSKWTLMLFPEFARTIAPATLGPASTLGNEWAAA